MSQKSTIMTGHLGQFFGTSWLDDNQSLTHWLVILVIFFGHNEPQIIHNNWSLSTKMISCKQSIFAKITSNQHSAITTNKVVFLCISGHMTITCFPDDAPLCVLILSNTTYRRPHLVSSWCCCCWANWYCDPALNAQNQQGFQIQQNEDIWSIADNILPSLRFSQTVGGIPVFSEFLSSYTCTGCGLECSVLRVILSYTFCPRKYER